MIATKVRFAHKELTFSRALRRDRLWPRSARCAATIHPARTKSPLADKEREHSQPFGYLLDVTPLATGYQRVARDAESSLKFTDDRSIRDKTDHRSRVFILNRLDWSF